MLYGHHIDYSKSKDQPGKVANPARGQLNRENEYFPVPFAPKNLVSRDGFGSVIPRRPAHLHTQTESLCCARAGMRHAIFIIMGSLRISAPHLYFLIFTFLDFMLSLGLCRSSSDHFLSGRPRTIEMSNGVEPELHQT